MTTSPSDPPAQLDPLPQTLLAIMRQELGLLYDGRLVAAALLEDTKAEAIREIATRDAEIASLRARMAQLEDDARGEPAS